MIGLIQRVKNAAVTVDGQCIARIEKGLLVLVGVQRDDDPSKAERLLKRLLAYRIFPDDQGRMNLGLQDIAGELLLVPQFTLAADTAKGNRPGFSTAAAPEYAESLFNHLVEAAKAAHRKVESGRFGADMQVSLLNDGPVTFWLES
tara:strand:- start:4373 stop:4810 length:438 start_codon:yes stop_codon:yes gene_type:complete